MGAIAHLEDFAPRRFLLSECEEQFTRPRRRRTLTTRAGQMDRCKHEAPTGVGRQREDANEMDTTQQEFEYLDATELENARQAIRQWQSACRAALEHGTEFNNRKADVAAGTLAGYVAPLLSMLNEIQRMSNVGLMFDGRDELNEDTHEENEQVLMAALDRIFDLTRGEYEE